MLCMVFSGSRLELFGVLFSVALMFPLMRWLFRHDIRKTANSPHRLENIGTFSKIGRYVLAILLIAFSYFILVWGHFMNPDSALLLFCFSFALFLYLLFYVKKILDKTDYISLKTDGVADIEECHDGKEAIIRKLRTWWIMGAFVIWFIMTFAGAGSVAFFRYMVPDICEVTCKGKGYEVVNYYGWPEGHKVSLTHSYLDNQTSDTLYRVVVSYAYLGEELYNHYNVTNACAPGGFTVMSSRPHYVMKRILPAMLPSHGKLGRYHTNRVYIVGRPSLDEFERRNMQCFGLRGNKKIDSFDITKNDIIYENPEKYITLERVTDNIERNCRKARRRKLMNPPGN